MPVLLVLWLMAQNNNNGELFDPATGQWDISYALSIASVIYGLSFAMIFGVSFLVACLCRSQGNRSQRDT